MANIIFSQSSGLNDALYGNWQAPLQTVIMKRAEAFEQESIYDKIFTKVNSTKFAESYTSMTSMDGFKPVGENGAAPVDGFEQSYDKLLRNVEWRNSFSISRAMVDDSLFVDLKQRPEAFVTSYYRTNEEFGAALLGSAMSGSKKTTFREWDFDITSADGVPLFTSAHPSKTKKGSTQGNLFADAISSETLEAMETSMQNFTDDNGKIVSVNPDTIIIPNILAVKRAAYIAAMSMQEPETANNAMNPAFSRFDIIVWPYLNRHVKDGDAPWILFDSQYNELYKGGVWQERAPLEVTSWVDNSTKANVWDGYARFTAGFHDWRAFALGGVAGAGSLI